MTDNARVWQRTGAGILVLVVASACASTTQPSTTATMNTIPMLVDACRTEAASDHAILGPRNREWRVEVKAHKARAAANCDAWLTVTPASVGALKGQCELEASGGQAIGRVTYHPDHIARMKDLCARLAEATNTASATK